MRKPSDKQLAILMLAGRGVPLTFVRLVRANTKRYLLLVAVFSLALLLIAFLAMWTVFFAVLGMLLGALLRDVGWARSIRSTSEFSEKVTDWDKVQSFADREGR